MKWGLKYAPLKEIYVSLVVIVRLLGTSMLPRYYRAHLIIVMHHNPLFSYITWWLTYYHIYMCLTGTFLLRAMHVYLTDVAMSLIRFISDIA